MTQSQWVRSWFAFLAGIVLCTAGAVAQTASTPPAASPYKFSAGCKTLLGPGTPAVLATPAVGDVHRYLVLVFFAQGAAVNSFGGPKSADPMEVGCISHSAPPVSGAAAPAASAAKPFKLVQFSCPQDCIVVRPLALVAAAAKNVVKAGTTKDPLDPATDWGILNAGSNDHRSVDIYQIAVASYAEAQEIVLENDATGFGQPKDYRGYVVVGYPNR